MKLIVIPLLLAAAVVSACSGGNPLTTSALMGGNAAKAPEPVQAANDPVARAMQVGTTSARALKCGFNVDPAKMRTQFLAAEAAANPADATRITQVYDTAYKGVTRAVATQSENYCSERKVAQIKSSLTRHLAGDYSPEPPEPQAEEEEGLFGSLGSGSTGGTEGMSKFQKPMSEW
jgi:hypothetical protein